MDSSYILFAVLLFVAVALGLEGLYQVWASKSSGEAKRLAARLRAIDSAGRETPLTVERAEPSRHWRWLDDHLIALLPSGDKLIRYIETSGTGRTAGEMMVYTGVMALVGAFLPIAFGRPLLFSIAGALAFGVLPWFWLSAKRDARIRLFERQIPEALDLMGRAMRAGHAFPAAVQMVGDEMPEPIARDFRILFDEMNYGVPQHEALQRLADRVPIADLGFFVVAVSIQRESGGNLAELLDKISSIVRARLKLLGDVRTMSAEGRLSAWILGLLPFVVAFLINVLNPKFMSVLWTDSTGLQLIGGSAVSMVLAVIWMRKIIRIRV